MTVEITDFANVSISVSPSGVQGGNFGILGFLTNEVGVIGTAERGRAYTGLSSVGDDWEASSEVYKAANAFYSQTPEPTDFVVLMAFEAAQEAVLTGGGSNTFAELVAIGAGNFTISIDGSTVSIDDLDFSGVLPSEGVDGIADALEAAITAAHGSQLCTVEWTGYSFEIKSLVSGSSSIVGFADGTTGAGTSNAAEALGLEQHQGKLSEGLAAESPVQALTEAVSAGIEFIGLDVHKKWRDTKEASTPELNSAEEIAVWAEGNKKIFCNTSNDLTVLKSELTSDIMTALKNRTLRYTLSTFSKSVNSYPSSSVFGRAASVNFESTNSTITLNLKQMPTVVAEDLKPSEFAALRGKNGSAVVQIGKSANAYTNSQMASGSWLDTTHGLLWLENRCETDLFNLLYVENYKTPFTQTGINTTVLRLEKSLKAAVRNGLCAPGYLPDGTYLPEGFIVTAVPLEEVPVGDKSGRVYRGLSFKMVGAGALHEVVVSGEFTE